MDIVKSARQLRAEGKILESYKLLQANSGASGIHGWVVWQHQPCFWEDLQAGNCVMTRRKGSDAAFIKTLWSDQEFAFQFHRAARIPQDIAELERIFNSEYVSLVSDLNSLHWVIRDGQRKPWGVLSLTDISLTHRRAEVLLGVMKGTPFGLVTTAMLLLFRFWFGVLKFSKLYTLTFDDNALALRTAQHLGFKVEGRLRKHFYDATQGKFVDMVQASLLAEEAFSASNKRLMKRLQFKQV